MAASFWRRTPPALFPATLGMFGLSLGWRSAVEAIDAPDAVWRLLLAATGLFFIFAFGAYIAKAMRRPSVVLEDMNPVPGRAAVSAGETLRFIAAAVVDDSLLQGLLRRWGSDRNPVVALSACEALCTWFDRGVMVEWDAAMRMRIAELAWTASRRWP